MTSIPFGRMALLVFVLVIVGFAITSKNLGLYHRAQSQTASVVSSNQTTDVVRASPVKAAGSSGSEVVDSQHDEKESASASLPPLDDAVVPALRVETGDQPTPTTAPAGALRVPFTRFTLTAGDKDVKVSGVRVQLSGLASSGAVDTVNIVNDEGEELGKERGFDANRQATLGNPFTIPANKTMTLTVVGNMAEDEERHAGEIPSISVLGVNASAEPTGTLPIIGTGQTVNSTLKIGTALTELSQFDPNGNTTRYINDKGIRFSGIRVTAGTQEDLILHGISWNQIGSASADDIANLVTTVGDNSYAVEGDGREFSSSFGDGIRIPKGNSVDIYLSGDLTSSGAGRTAEFDVRLPDDIDLEGGSYGFGISPKPGGNTDSAGHSVFLTDDGTTEGESLQPYFSGSIVTISGGAATYIGR